jgi:hypothetical protein
LVKVNKPDPAADALAERLGGESRVKFENDPKGREIDAISDEYGRRYGIEPVIDTTPLE